MTDPEEAERAEARDPNTPPARLAELMKRYAGDALRNPALPLVLLEDPDFWRKLSPIAMKAIAESPDCPAAFVEWVTLPGNGGRRPLPLAQNRALGRDLRRRAFLKWGAPAQPWGEARPLLAEFLTGVELALLDRAGAGGTWEEPAPVVALTEAEFWQLDALGELGRNLAVGHPACPAALLDRLLDEANHRLQQRALCHPNVSPARLALSLASADPDLRGAALQNPALTRDQLEEAARQPATWWHLAQNPALPAEWVARFLVDPSPQIRASLAGNPSLSAEAQLALAGDADWQVRDSVLNRQRVTPEARARAIETNERSRPGGTGK